ncbi:MAG: hypothetical protein K2X35_16515 [Bryobacteraceae bacterium]|nr:hypothetical protein [Bryobacteraceae bacterium]
MRGLIFLLAAVNLLGQDAVYKSARHKQKAIADGRAPRGSTVTFSQDEITAFAKVHVPLWVPAGIRGQKVTVGSGTAQGNAMVDFLNMQHARGVQYHWTIERLIRGERPLQVNISLQSDKGRATVHLDRVEISRVPASGSVLDFMVDTFFLSLFPQAKINQPFELDYNIQQIRLVPGRVLVTMKP